MGATYIHTYIHTYTYIILSCNPIPESLTLKMTNYLALQFWLTLHISKAKKIPPREPMPIHASFPAFQVTPHPILSFPLPLFSPPIVPFFQVTTPPYPARIFSLLCIHPFIPPPTSVPEWGVFVVSVCVCVFVCVSLVYFITQNSEKQKHFYMFESLRRYSQIPGITKM